MNIMETSIKNPERIMEGIRNKVFSMFRHRKFKRFIVLSRSRTGSNMLISFLNSHPLISAQGELFGKLEGRNYRDILDSVFSKQPLNIKAAGFKIFYYHPLDDEACGIWNDLESMHDLCVIHLKRRNILRTIISRKIAGIQDIWAKAGSAESHSPEKKSVEFSVSELEHDLRQTMAWEDEGDRKFSRHPLITVYYEDLVERPEREFRRITDLLGLEYRPPKTKLKKQNPEKMRNLVTNYEELKAAFVETEWQDFFEDS